MDGGSHCKNTLDTKFSQPTMAYRNNNYHGNSGKGYRGKGQGGQGMEMGDTSGQSTMSFCKYVV